MIRKTRGIVLHTIRYGESSLVVHCFTEQFGRQAYMVKGVRKSRRNNRSNLFQPLFILDLEVYHKETRELQMVKEVSRSFPLNSLPYDVTKSTQAIFMAEVLYRVVREEEPNPMLAHFLVHAIQYLDALEEPDPDFHIIFLFHLSRFLGFFPRRNREGNLKYFDLVSGQFVPAPGDPEVHLGEEESQIWSRYLESGFRQIPGSSFSSMRRKAILDQLVKYYQLHVAGMGPVRSLEVLHAFFHS